jgi:myo-inositol-1-phosphate synthase
MPPNSVAIHEFSDSAPLAFKVNSPNVVYAEGEIRSQYVYQTSVVAKDPITSEVTVTPKETVYEFKTKTHVPRVG